MTVQMNFMSRLVAWSLLLMLGLMTLGMGAGVAWAQDAKRSITKIAGDLYRFQNNFHYSVFLVTSEGVIATDPINAEAAAWLKKEIAARFGQEVKYLIYSHDHRDHIAGDRGGYDDMNDAELSRNRRVCLDDDKIGRIGF